MEEKKRLLLILVILLVPIGVNANMLFAKAYPLELQSGYTDKQAFLGRTIGERETDIGFERSGYIAKLTVNDGQSVQQGQVLATLDTTRLEQNRKVLLAERQAIVPELAFARKQLARQKSLLAKGHASEQEYDRAFSRTESLHANLIKVDADLGSNDVELDKSILRAHFAAVVLERFQHQGTFIQSGQRVLRLQQRDIREAHIGISQLSVTKIKKGSCYPITVQQQIYKGCVMQIVPQLSERTQTMRVIFQLDTDSEIISGELAHLSIKTIKKIAGYWVPTHALVGGRRGTWQVYALAPEKQSGVKYKIVPVAVNLIYSNGARSYIQGEFSGLTNIIAHGVHKYSPGEVVNKISE